MTSSSNIAAVVQMTVTSDIGQNIQQASDLISQVVQLSCEDNDLTIINVCLYVIIKISE